MEMEIVPSFFRFQTSFFFQPSLSLSSLLSPISKEFQELYSLVPRVFFFSVTVKKSTKLELLHRNNRNYPRINCTIFKNSQNSPFNYPLPFTLDPNWPALLCLDTQPIALKVSFSVIFFAVDLCSKTKLFFLWTLNTPFCGKFLHSHENVVAWSERFHQKLLSRPRTYEQRLYRIFECPGPPPSPIALCRRDSHAEIHVDGLPPFHRFPKTLSHCTSSFPFFFIRTVKLTPIPILITSVTQLIQEGVPNIPPCPDKVMIYSNSGLELDKRRQELEKWLRDVCHSRFQRPFSSCFRIPMFNMQVPFRSL